MDWFKLTYSVLGGLGIFFGVPQALRVRRLGHGRGVSLFSWTLQFGVAISWATYGLDAKSPSVLLTNLGAAVVNASVILAILKNNVKSISLLTIYAATLATLILILPSAVVSTLLIALVFAQSPQVVKSFHNIRVGKDSAVSITALSVSCFSILIWILYGFMADDSLIKVSALVALSINSLIIALDCGIKAIDKVAYAKEKGIDFINSLERVEGMIVSDRGYASYSSGFHNVSGFSLLGLKNNFITE